jgi:hypothetical protein
MEKPYNDQYEPTASGVFDIPEVEYHRIKALNNSSMKTAYDYSMLHFKCRLDGQGVGKPITPQQQSMFDFGSAVDLAIFEPERFKNEVVIAAHKKGTNKYKAWIEGKEDMIILSQENFIRAQGTAMAVFKKKAASRLLESGWAQKSIIWKHPVYGFWCKGRTDWLCDTEEPIVTDLKTTEKAVYHRFKWIARNLKYYWQAYWYLTGLTITTGTEHKQWRWLVAETYPPHESIVYVTDKEGVEEAGEQIEEVCERYAECLETGIFPGYPDEEVVLGEDLSQYKTFDVDDDDIPY